MDKIETTKTILDSISILNVLGTIIALLPPLAALFSIVWSVIRITETDTYKNWRKNRKRKYCVCGEKNDKGSKSRRSN